MQEFNNSAYRRPPLRQIDKCERDEDGEHEPADEDGAAQRRIEDNPALARLAGGKFRAARILSASETLGATDVDGPL
jgi:hypothetical protein